MLPSLAAGAIFPKNQLVRKSPSRSESFSQRSQGVTAEEREVARAIGESTDGYLLALSKGERLSSAASSLIAAADVVEKAIDDGSQGLTAEHKVKPVSRTTTSVKATATNRITKVNTSIPTTTIRWQHVGWEFSAGLWVSDLNKRAFKVIPVVENGAQVAGQTTISETSSSVSTVPSFFLHKTWLEWQPGEKRLSMMPTAGIGARDGAAELAVGISVAWGDLFVSGLAHRGRDIRLTNGLVVGQINPPPIEGLQERYWNWSAAVALSYRVPIQ